MKKIIIGALVIASLFLVKPVMAEWQRLVITDDSINVNGSKLMIVYDKVEKVNCYVVVSDQFAVNENRSSSIDCVPAK